MATVAPGTRFGVYEVIDAIGVGGMATVYRARDTRLPREAAIKIYLKPADGSGEEHLISDVPGVPTDWSADGRLLLFTSTAANTGGDIWAVTNPERVSGPTRSIPVLATSSNEFHGQLSPDGRWLAYTSDESAGSGDSVYVRPFPADGRHDAAGARWLVSGAEFGLFPRWRSDGKQLFYTTVTNFSVMAADVDTSRGFRTGTPRRVVGVPPPLIPVGWNLTPDAQRFLFITSPNGGRPLPFTVVLNWAAALKK